MTYNDKKLKEFTKEVLKILAKAAEETVFYAALGKCLAKEMSEKHGIENEKVKGLLSVVACKLVAKIREMK